MAEFDENFGKLGVETLTVSFDESVVKKVQPVANTDSGNPFDKVVAVDDDNNVGMVDEALIASSSNPFVSDGDEIEEDNTISPMATPRTKMNTPQRKQRFNPFDDGELEEEDTEETLFRRRTVTESLASITLSSMMATATGLRTASTESTPSSYGDMPSKTYAKQIQTLMLLGFDRVVAINALIKTSGELDKARSILVARLLDDHVLTSNGELYVWRSPVVVRIGGWLPNVQDALGTVHTAYFISVTMTFGNETWRIPHRYSAFYNFYCTIYPRICKVFPSGMENPFPTDRMSNWLIGGNKEALNDTRQRKLNAWFRELCNVAEIMLDEKTRTYIFDFLQVDANLARLSRLRESAGGGNNNQTHPDSKNKPFRSRGAEGLNVTPATSSWQSPSCCQSPGMRGGGGGAGHPTVSISDLMNDYSVSGGGGEGSIGLSMPGDFNDEFAERGNVVARRKAALASQQNDNAATFAGSSTSSLLDDVLSAQTKARKEGKRRLSNTSQASAASVGSS